MTYREALGQGERRLLAAEIPDAATDAWLLLSLVCQIDRNFYYMYGGEEMELEKSRQYEMLLDKRASHIPLQYITGEQEFMGMTFHVDSSVLIPRQDTEILVEEALKVITPGMEILDICTGSGCIAVSIAKLKPDVKVWAADVSQQALQVAKENSKENEAEVLFFQSDMFEKIDKKFDVILSNPPYIPTEVIKGLMPEVRDFEPMLALDGEKDGLKFYRILAKEGKKHLNPGGRLMVEIGYDQGEAVRELFWQQGYREIKVIKDLAGLDRVVIGKDEGYV